MGSLARLGEMNSIPGTWAGSPWRDLALSLVSLENSPRVYTGTRVSPPRGLFIWENSIPGTRAGSPRRDLAISLASLENSPRVYMGTRASPSRRDLLSTCVDIAYPAGPGSHINARRVF